MKQITWNLSDLFASDDDPGIEENLKNVEHKNYEFINKWRGRDDYLKEPAVLKEALDEFEELERNYGASGDAGFYFNMRRAQEQNNPKIKARLAKIKDAAIRIENDIQFFTLNVSRIMEQEKFLTYEPLKEYRHYLERLFAGSRYLLSDPEEKIMNLKSSTSYSNWVRLTSGLLAKQQRKILGREKLQTFAEVISTLDNPNKKVRDSAAKALNSMLYDASDVAESEINSVLENKKTDDFLRKIPRPDMARHISDDIDTEVVDTLVRQVSSRFDIPARHYRLKAKLLGLKKLEYHERNVPYGKLTKKYSYEEATEIVRKALDGIDERFSEIFGRLLKEGRFDVYPRLNKAAGAFCAANLIRQPVYILLNHTGKITDVLTIAHETGHAINDELAKKQNSLNYGTSLATAEVASTFMEDFALDEILKESGKLELSLRIMKLDQDISSIFRQVAAYSFEQELHKEFREKGYLSKEDIGKLFRKHMSAYMGDYVRQSPGSENWWVYWSHIRYFFYNYSYASGLLISKSMQNSVRADKAFAEKVVEFLSAGESDSPKNIFLKMGIDITKKEFWDKGIDEIDSFLRETEKLMN
jgi:oligoendopeptidase F